MVSKSIKILLIKSSFYSATDKLTFLLTFMLKIAFDKIFKHPLDKNHRFPMVKYELLPEQLLSEGTCSTNNFFLLQILMKK